MAQLVVSSVSTEYVLSQVIATIGGLVIDPTGDVVQMAFLTPGVTPQAGDWKTAGWEVNTVTNPHTYSAKCLIGPNGVIQLAAGAWDVWVKITDNPEVPAKKSGQLRVF